MQSLPPRSDGIVPVPPPPASSNNQIIYWDTPIENRGAQYESKDPTGLWSVGGSTTVSLAGNMATLSDEEPTWQSSFRRHFDAKVDTKNTDILLIMCGFVSGLVDGLSFNAWGSFASMQTGNSVFIALGASGQPAYPAYLWAKSLIALVVFITGNLVFIRTSRALGARRRSTLILSFAVQTTMLFAAALLVQLGAVDPRPEDPRAPIDWMQVLPISLLSFQAAGQIVSSRVLEFDEIPTVVLTTLLCDLLVDPHLGKPLKANAKRNRRIGAFLALFLGAMTAGGISKVTEMAASLWLAMGLKLIITASWFVWKAEQRKKDTGLGGA